MGRGGCCPTAGSGPGPCWTPSEKQASAPRAAGRTDTAPHVPRTERGAAPGLEGALARDLLPALPPPTGHRRAGGSTGAAQRHGAPPDCVKRPCVLRSTLGTQNQLLNQNTSAFNQNPGAEKAVHCQQRGSAVRRRLEGRACGSGRKVPAQPETRF